MLLTRLPALLATVSFALGFASNAIAVDAASKVPERLALVIGNSGYTVFQFLRNPLNDAADMCAALKKVGFAPECYTNVRDRAEFMQRVDEFARRLSPSSEALFYYAGHAIQVHGENFLIPTAASVRSPQEVQTQFVGMNDVFDRINRTQSRFQMVILDACREESLYRQAFNHVCQGWRATVISIRSSWCDECG